MSESTSQPYLSADFGKDGGRFNWMTHEEVTKWVGQLQNDWAWIGKHRVPPVANTWTAISQGLSSASQSLTNAISHKKQNQEKQAESQLAAARSALESLVRANPWLLPGNSRRLFVEELRDAGQAMEAALIVAYWMGQDFNNGAPIRQSINALLKWELHERGIKDRMKTENAALRSLAGDMRSTLSEFQRAERIQAERFDQLHTQVTEQNVTQQSTFDTAQTQRDAQWGEQLSAMKGELDQLKETYDKHMALAAPVEYWERKRRQHGRWALLSFIATVACMAAVGWALHTELQDVGKAVERSRVIKLQALSEVQKSSGAKNQLPAVGTAEKPVEAANQSARSFAANESLVTPPSLFESAATWKIGSFILLATLSFWFIRLLVRIFLSNLHLENDAAERVTMAKTYLAMIRDDALPKGDGINSVLAALFRPSGDGIVRDEGLPPTAMEWMTKLGGKS